MPKECGDNNDNSARAGDRYYSAISKWVRSRGRSPELHENASYLGRIYGRTLQLALDCLRRLRRTPAVERKIDATIEFQTLLKKDMDLLSKSRDTGDTQREIPYDNTP